MRENMEQHFNTPAEVIDNNMKAGEGKAHLPLGKMILLGIMAGFHCTGRSYQQYCGACY